MQLDLALEMAQEPVLGTRPLWTSPTGLLPQGPNMEHIPELSTEEHLPRLSPPDGWYEDSGPDPALVSGSSSLSSPSTDPSPYVHSRVLSLGIPGQPAGSKEVGTVLQVWAGHAELCVSHKLFQGDKAASSRCWSPASIPRNPPPQRQAPSLLTQSPHTLSCSWSLSP